MVATLLNVVMPGQNNVRIILTSVIMALLLTLGRVRLNRPSSDAVKCTWNEDDDNVKEPKPKAQRKLGFIENSHKIDYFCGCRVHTGLLYLVELAHNNFKAVCSGGKDRLQEKFDFPNDKFMVVLY